MNIFDFAKLLDGREMGKEITGEEQQLANLLGLVVVFGYADDCALLSGPIHTEVSCYDGGTLYFDEHGLLINRCKDKDCPYFEQLKMACKTIEAVWDEEGYSWTYKTDIPHATFDIFEDGEKFCRGIVFDIKDLGGAKL